MIFLLSKFIDPLKQTRISYILGLNRKQTLVDEKILVIETNLNK